MGKTIDELTHEARMMDEAEETRELEQTRPLLDEMRKAVADVPSYVERIQRDAAEWFQVGDTVRIDRPGELHGQYGTIYGYIGGRPHPWQVRPNGWPEDVPGVALKTDELHLQ